jgi:hypothetical protein
VSSLKFDAFPILSSTKEAAVPDQTPPPEGTLIRVAREARGLSPETAAEQTSIRLGGARWRQIERGYKGRGQVVRAPARTLAHMAHLVGVTPERLREAGREDAAEVLEEILRQEAAAAPPAEAYADDPRVTAMADMLATLPIEMQEEVFRLVQRQPQQPAQRRPRTERRRPPRAG